MGKDQQHQWDRLFQFATRILWQEGGEPCLRLFLSLMTLHGPNVFQGTQASHFCHQNRRQCQQVCGWCACRLARSMTPEERVALVQGMRHVQTGLNLFLTNHRQRVAFSLWVSQNMSTASAVMWQSLGSLSADASRSTPASKHSHGKGGEREEEEREGGGGHLPDREGEVGAVDAEGETLLATLD